MLRTNHSFLTFIEKLYGKTELQEHLSLKKFNKGTLLLRQGTVVQEVFIIKKGITKCFLTEENGKDFIVEFLGEGEITGEIEVIRSNTCLCNIEAITSVDAYSLSVSFFKELVSKNAVFNQMLLEEMAERVINTASRSSSQQLYAVQHGLKKILDFQSRQHVTLAKEDMAAYLGITLRSLNRALRDIDPAGAQP